MTYANFKITRYGALAVSDPDPDEFIDGLAAGLTVKDMVLQRDSDVPISEMFWINITQKLCDLLSHNAQYDQAVINKMIEEAKAPLLEKIRTLGGDL